MTALKRTISMAPISTTTMMIKMKMKRKTSSTTRILTTFGSRTSADEAEGRSVPEVGVLREMPVGHTAAGLADAAHVTYNKLRLRSVILHSKVCDMARKKIDMRPDAADALKVLGQQIRLARHDRGWTATELAEQLSVSPRTVASIESGSPGSSIGTVFNAASLLGVHLFGIEDRFELAQLRRRGEERIALIPSRVRRPEDDSDDFSF